MSLFKISYENALGNEITVAYLLDEIHVFDYMNLLMEKLNTTIYVEKVKKEDIII
nr:hypothetical protein [uncultured Methanobrevibacter sp.]